VLGFAVVRRTRMLAPLRCVCTGGTMRPGGDDLFALIVVLLRFFLVRVPRSGQAISARHPNFRGDLAEEFEIVSVAATMAGPRRCPDRHRVSVGARVDGMPRTMDLSVLLVGIFLVVDVGPSAEDRLDQVDAQRAPGSGP